MPGEMDDLMPDNQQERSGSGHPIIRYSARNLRRDPSEFVEQDAEAGERIGTHIEAYVGSIDGVFHEIASDIVHVDVHHVTPTDQRPYHTLVTSGMSDRPMAAPPGFERKHLKRHLWRRRDVRVMLVKPPGAA